MASDRISHVAIQVTNMEKSIDYYSMVHNMKVTEKLNENVIFGFDTSNSNFASLELRPVVGSDAFSLGDVSVLFSTFFC